MWPFQKKNTELTHIDYKADPQFLDSMENDFFENIEIFRFKEPEHCCTRFSEAVLKGEILYAYKEFDDIDETAWFVESKWHIYFCPFCGTNVRGIGFGSYHKANTF